MSERAQDWITAAALIAALVLAGLSHLRYLEAAATTERMRPLAERTVVHDRLMGRTIDLSEIDPSISSDGDRDAVTFVWVLDLERCVGCLGEMHGWAELEARSDDEFRLLLIGSPTPDVEARIRLLGRTRVVEVERGSAYAAFGALLPNTRVVLGADGTVLLVDSRAAGQDCGWSFEAQAGSLRGIEGAAARIRR